jgi:hypothetical protein
MINIASNQATHNKYHNCAKNRAFKLISFGGQVHVIVHLEEMPARLVERAGEPVVFIQIPRPVNPLLPRQPLCREDMLGLGSGAGLILLGLDRVPPEAVAENADLSELRGGLPVGSEERVVERRLAVGHVEQRWLVHAAAAPVVEARDGEAEGGGGGALGGGEDGGEEVGGVREEGAAGEDSKLPTPRRERRVGPRSARRRRNGE